MKTINFNNNEQEWLDYRKGKVTGTRLKDLVLKRTKKPKIGFYEMVAESVAIPINENMMLRGKELEKFAIEEFAKRTKKKVSNDLVIWQREDNEKIAISPDGVISKTEAVEVKCLGNARHLEALLNQEIPSEYHYQVLQYFVVNDDLKKLYFVFYDPQITKDLFWIEVTREELGEEIKECFDLEVETLKKIEDITNKLTF